MEKKFGLSETEYEIMEFLWSSDHKLTFREILEYFNTVKNKDWKKQTLSTFLTILQKEGYILADMSGKKYLYYPAQTKDAHITAWVRQLCKNSFENSLGNFLTAFSGGQKLSQEDADELRAYLKSYEDIDSD
ncbi:MAG: BlaI/MecI/CopY family transcriptional regulator [Eubacteriales bacterium]|nr:BlaI/MecI/CopY family transcriptional regulator [Eubacteriales bacterium]